MLGEKKDILVRTLLLLGFLILLFSLITSNQLTLYVHPRGEKLIIISAYLLAVMFVLQCRKLKQVWKQSIKEGNTSKAYWKYSPFVLTLLIAFLLPTSALNASLVNNKGLNSQITTDVAKAAYRPMAEELAQSKFIKVTDQNFLAVMTEINLFPQDYVGKEIEMKGFISKGKSTAPETFSVARYVVGCCVGDASPYGLVGKTPEVTQYTDGNWVEMQGIVETSESNGKKFPIIKITWIKPTVAAATPYIFP